MKRRTALKAAVAASAIVWAGAAFAADPIIVGAVVLDQWRQKSASART